MVIKNSHRLTNVAYIEALVDEALLISMASTTYFQISALHACALDMLQAYIVRDCSQVRAN